MRDFAGCRLESSKGTRIKIFYLECGFGTKDILSPQKSAKSMSRLVKLAPLQTPLRQ